MFPLALSQIIPLIYVRVRQVGVKVLIIKIKADLIFLWWISAVIGGFVKQVFKTMGLCIFQKIFTQKHILENIYKQDSHRSLKTWKVLEFLYRSLKVLEFDHTDLYF